MAATNFTPIILYHTTTASAAPTAGNLNNGELAININDGKLFYKDSGGTVQVIATKGTGTIGGSNTQVQYNSSGALAGSANFTFNGTTATINTLNLTNALGTAYGGTALTTYTQGDLVYASAANTLAKLGIGANTYILTSTGSVPQWSAPSAVTVSTANNLAGGSAGSVPYQSGAGVTTFLSIGTANTVMTSSGTAPQWSSSLTLGGNLVVNGNTTLGDAAADNLTVNATITSNLIFTDNTYDIGASGATRPRNLYLAGLLTMGGALTVNGNTTLGDAAADTLTVNSTITSNLIFTDNTYDIGASGATRPRNLFLGNNLAVGGNETITGYLGVGAAASSSNAINIASTNLTGAYQVGLQTALVGTSAATAGVFGIYTYPATAAAAFTTASVVGLYAENAVKGAGSTITNQYGVFITDQTQGANNFGLYSGVTSGANKFNLYVGGSAANYLEGALTVNSGSSVFNESGGDNDFRVESDLNTHMLFVDAGNNRVAVGNNAPISRLDISSTSSGGVVAMSPTDGLTLITGGYNQTNSAGIVLSGGQGNNNTNNSWTISAVASGSDGTHKNVLAFSTGAYNGSSFSLTRRVTMDGGALQIGTTAYPPSIYPSGLQVASTTVFVPDNTGNAGNRNWAIQTNGSQAGALDFVDSSANNTWPNNAYRVAFTPYGINLGGATNTSGMGITFPATQVASSNANTLDDYEEGTWTPTTSAGGVTLTNLNSYYTKIGRLVHVYAYVEVDNSGGTLAGITWTGLPFAALSYAPALRYYKAGAGSANTQIWAADTYTESGAAQIVDNNDIGSGISQIMISATYFVS